ncbi:hypothetical protein BMG523Draft_03761, partial [Frankia sp. BMG5.23]
MNQPVPGHGVDYSARVDGRGGYVPIGENSSWKR